MILYLLVALMVALWSGNYIFAKIALREVPPLLLMVRQTDYRSAGGGKSVIAAGVILTERG